MGIGGQAAVYKVFDERLRVHRAIKVLLPEFARRGPLRERFQSEAHAMANLDHPGIVRVFDVVPDAELPFIVMEFVPGGSLAQWIEQHGLLPPRLAVRCTLQVAAAIGAAHRAGVIHRDVKPHNVLIDAKGHCKLGDFGIARAGGAVLRTLVGARMGTEGYMAPEQSNDASRADARADIFGLGVTLWVMLAARDPIELFREGTLEAVPEPLQRVIRRATAHDPEARYANVRAFASDLDAAATLLGGDPPSPPLIQPTPCEVDDFREISLIARKEEVVARARESRVSEAPELRPVILGYVMPNYERETPDGEPDWLVEEAQREPIKHYAISPAPTLPSEGRAPEPEPEPERPPVAHDMLASMWDTVGVQLPLLALPGVLIALGSVIFAHVTLISLRSDVVEASDTFQRVLQEDFVVVDALANLGADDFQLRAQWDAVVYAGSAVDRQRESLGFANLMETEAERVAAPGSETWAQAESGVSRICAARDELLRAEREYEAREQYLGAFAPLVRRPVITPPWGRTRGLGVRVEEPAEP